MPPKPSARPYRRKNLWIYADQADFLEDRAGRYDVGQAELMRRLLDDAIRRFKVVEKKGEDDGNEKESRAEAQVQEVTPIAAPVAGAAALGGDQVEVPIR